jgi:hypothetical protein
MSQYCPTCYKNVAPDQKHDCHGKAFEPSTPPPASGHAELPDKNCYTLPDGSCIGGPCMHDVAPALEPALCSASHFHALLKEGHNCPECKYPPAAPPEGGSVIKNRSTPADREFWNHVEEVAAKVRESSPPEGGRGETVAYMCPSNCGCLWRDNGDGTMSLFGPNSKSCLTCEFLPLSRLVPLYRTDLARVEGPFKAKLHPFVDESKCDGPEHEGLPMISAKDKLVCYVCDLHEKYDAMEAELEKVRGEREQEIRLAIVGARAQCMEHIATLEGALRRLVVKIKALPRPHPFDNDYETHNFLLAEAKAAESALSERKG